MTFEVDVLAVGEESKSGDAIAFRYGDFSHRSLFKVVIIDGGFEKNGQDLVDLVKGTYQTDSVDIVISTHPDSDHCSGLKVVLEKLHVESLWLHQPWRHERAIAEYIQFGKSSKELDEQLQKSIASARDLEELAADAGVQLIEPFAGLQTEDGRLTVLGPTRDYYAQLLANFEDASTSRARLLAQQLRTLLKEAAAKMRELWSGQEALIEPEENATRPQNNSSVILLAKLDDTYFVFTGDAGVPALDRAVSEELGAALRAELRYFQLPHHGSKRNVGPSILDRILGPRVAQGVATGKTTFISAASDGKPKHPAQRVINAANRRGAKVISTQGRRLLMHSNDAPARDRWVPAAELPFVEQYED